MSLSVWWRNIARKTGVPPVPEPDSQAVQIARSLRNDPEDWAWKHKGYTLRHVPSGFLLWVANKGWGLAEDTGAQKNRFKESERKIIWPAVETWLARFKTGFSLKPKKPRMRFRGDVWRCYGQDHPWVGLGDTPGEAYRSWVAAISVQARKELGDKMYFYVWGGK